MHKDMFQALERQKIASPTYYYARFQKWQTTPRIGAAMTDGNFWKTNASTGKL